MTNHTALYNLPAPDGTDLVIGGDDAIEALAAHLETILTPAAFRSPLTGSSPGQALGASEAEIAFPALVGVTPSGVFTLEDSGKDLTYHGPDRWFSISINVLISLGGADIADTRWQNTIAVKLNGTMIDHSEGMYDNVNTVALEGDYLRTTHAVTIHPHLSDGDVITVTGISTNAAAVVGARGLSGCSISPAEDVTP